MIELNQSGLKLKELRDRLLVKQKTSNVHDKDLSLKDYRYVLQIFKGGFKKVLVLVEDMDDFQEITKNYVIDEMCVLSPMDFYNIFCVCPSCEKIMKKQSKKQTCSRCNSVFMNK